MCLICVELQKGMIAPSSFAEKIDMVLREDPEHEEELIKALSNADERYLDQLEKYLQDRIERNLIDILISR